MSTPAHTQANARISVAALVERLGLSVYPPANHRPERPRTDLDRRMDSLEARIEHLERETIYR